MEYQVHFIDNNPVIKFLDTADGSTEAKVINLWDQGMEIEGESELEPDAVLRIALEINPDLPPFLMEGLVLRSREVYGKTRTTLQFLSVETPRAYESYLVQTFYESFAA